jgi:hypothetical protein
MLYTMSIAMGAVIVLMLFWILIQTIWRNVFRDYIQDEDVLADRRSCANCGCSGQTCTRSKDATLASPGQ